MVDFVSPCCFVPAIPALIITIILKRGQSDTNLGVLNLFDLLQRLCHLLNHEELETDPPFPVITVCVARDVPCFSPFCVS
jgi:hypothetical protein